MNFEQQSIQHSICIMHTILKENADVLVLLKNKICV